jgi:hypothetical protein
MPESPIPSQPLRGWKEIAGHVGTSIRSAQRYASDLALPVHRRGTKGAPVVAFAEELDEWLRRQTPIDLDVEQAAPTTAEAPSALGTDRGWWRVPGRVMATSVVFLASLWAIWNLSGDGSQAVTLGVQVGEKGRSKMTVPSKGSATVTLKTGDTIWIVPALEGERLRLALYNLPDARSDRKLIGLASLGGRSSAPPPSVSFQFGDESLWLQWVRDDRNLR